MAQWRPDPTFYPSPRMAMEAPPERFAYVALLNPKREGKHDALGVVDVAPSSSNYGQVMGKVERPIAGHELHTFGCVSCMSYLSPYALRATFVQC